MGEISGVQSPKWQSLQTWVIILPNYRTIVLLGVPSLTVVGLTFASFSRHSRERYVNLQKGIMNGLVGTTQQRQFVIRMCCGEAYICYMLSLGNEMCSISQECKSDPNYHVPYLALS